MIIKGWKQYLGTISLCLLILPITWSYFTKSPKGTSVEGKFYPIKDVDFIYDLTYQKEGNQVRDCQIFKEQLDVIDRAKEFILMDLFLFNDAYDREKYSYSNNIDTITQALITKKKENPSMDIILITDPINEFYGSYEEEHLKILREHGIITVITDLNQLKDSNPLYSGYYRFYFQWFGTRGNGWLPNILSPTGPKVNLRSMLKLLNFKANHRKVVITEQEAMVSSSNPHDPSANHSNVAIRCKGKVLEDLIESEERVACFSDTELPVLTLKEQKIEESDTKARVITEKKIGTALIESIKLAQKDDKICIGIFYISDFEILSALKEAGNRGVQIQIVADPNKDAFGLKKNGSPNRMALTSLVSKSDNIQVRWYHTHGEQYHSKLAFFQFKEEDRLILGSANYTRRNIKGYNLETDLEVRMSPNSNLSKEVEQYFKTIWNNEDGEYTVDFEVYRDDSIWKKILYQIQEFTGLSTF